MSLPPKRGVTNNDTPLVAEPADAVTLGVHRSPLEGHPKLTPASPTNASNSSECSPS
jgi:hypothetical protein